MNKKIMVIDDEEEIVNLVKIAFEMKNHPVAVAYSGEEGLAMLEANENPDLILLDIMMTGIGGYELFKKIRENKKFDNIKIVIFSAKAQADDIEKGLALGADDYIVKPFDPYELIDRVEEIIKKQ